MTELPLKDDMTKSAIDYLEKQGYSIIEWVDFDADDESTLPPEHYWVLNQDYEKVHFNYEFKKWAYGAASVTTVTKWAYLPTPKVELCVC